jgi:hypothetical protein
VDGPDLAARQLLYDFLVAELQARQAGGPQAPREVCTALANGRDELLAFAAQLDGDLAALAAEFAAPAAVLREVLAVQALDAREGRRWRREASLRAQLGERYHVVSAAVAELAGGVVRASSAAENVNSRLRNYFFLRRQVGEGSFRLFLKTSTHLWAVGKKP